MDNLLPLLFFFGAGFFAYEVFRGVKGGSTSMRYPSSDVSRAKQPVWFWFALSMNGIFAIGCSIFFVKGVIDHWG
ncbi:hypothetical protein [Novosphingobium sp. Rr 2-17]|uniref:hypothetical protein n=1 Tax=Novosphingobium sp. Rr 2-17 TaxID=555793 RepID=UPI001ED93673|nr:hypothetical protein [Novosphingobium sp. Rr 2-17]